MTLSAEKIIYEMSFADLAQIRTFSSASLTDTSPQNQPATVTTINERSIKLSGARNLNELLEIYVPNMQIIRAFSTGDHVGIRGFSGTRDEKYLLLVNDKIMNYRTLEGAESERHVMLMGDLYQVDVLRGPGSVIYGPGALSGFIQLKTHTGFTFEGTQIRLHQTFIEEASKFELLHGHKFSADTATFLYYGASNEEGAGRNDAPVVFGSKLLDYDAGDEVELDFVKDRHYAKVKHKFHFDLSSGNNQFWMRFTKDGLRQIALKQTLDTGLDVPLHPSRQNETEQFTAFNRYLQEFDELNIEYSLSLQHSQLKARRDYRTFRREDQETELFTRVLATWDKGDHSFALGTEASYEFFDNTNSGLLGDKLHWDVFSMGVMAENQWRISDKWTNFIGFRADTHRYTDWLLSPRWVLIYNPRVGETIKFSVSRSLRRSSDIFLRADGLDGKQAPEESLDSVELRYEKQVNENFNFASSAFFEVLSTVDVFQSNQSLIGRYKIAGLEFEAEYETEKWQTIFSHSFTKLIEGDEKAEVNPSHFTVEPKGYGNELANWSNHLSKLSVIYEANKKWQFNSSLIVYWGFPGSEDLANYNSFERTPGPGFAGLVDPGVNKPFGANVYLNMGAQHKFNNNIVGRLNLHNVLGWLDADLNKRNYRRIEDNYRSVAPAINLTLEYNF